MEKSNSQKTSIIVILTLVIVVMGSYFVYDKVFTKEEQTNKNESSSKEVFKNYEKSMSDKLPQDTLISRWENDIEYKVGITNLLVNKNKDAVMEFADGSALQKKYGKTYTVAKDVIYAESLMIGNNNQKVIFFIKSDGSLSYIYISSEDMTEIKVHDNLLNLKNVISIFNHTTYIENAASTVGLYALDIEGNIHSLDNAIYNNRQE